ncbi:hypothetical protein [Mesorhizobium sp. M8A.F.Ca.ET.021.01.1.1]|uniref:hypothetical protein n=1 Tax=Mesorhizobium sp. M8A.F.Ca.ET.021.01.1.1 TaxID=2496757 RepID=UPI000FC9D3B1|nr:hypothetical protein [Mesorhizobium sp. M8A.F.Ca.ET.021.01.1.1]RUW56713.1 hypothetical protein EOA36_02700 [Mesorhizobium sp. M8A.F.Ca.ET.021.01.1.1]
MLGWFRSLFGSSNKKAMHRASVQAARHLVDTKGSPLSLTDPETAIAAATAPRIGSKSRLLEAHDRASRGLGPQPDFSGAFAPRRYPEPSAEPVRTVAYPQSSAEPDVFNNVIVPMLIMDALTPDSPVVASTPVDSAPPPAPEPYTPEPAQSYEPPAPHSVDTSFPSAPTSYDTPSYAPVYDTNTYPSSFD